MRTYGSPEAFKQALEQRLRSVASSGADIARDTLGFAGIEPPTLRLYPVETHIAEKLHAYTMPRSRPNSRVKDLPDLALLAMTKEIDAVRLRAALTGTFAFRATHPVPVSVPAPPESWARPYSAMAREGGLAWGTLDEVTDAVRRFLDPALAHDLDARWGPSAWAWCDRRATHGEE